MMTRLTPPLIRGARGMLDWSMASLAEAAGLSVSTVRRMEAEAPPNISDAAFGMVRDAFERAGVRFLVNEGEGDGLRLWRF